MSGSDLEIAYEAILTQFVDPVDPAQLVKAASGALRDSLKDQVLLPLFTLPLDLQPDPTANAADDWTAFSSAYDAMVQKLPDWAAKSHPDWAVLQAMVASLDNGHSVFLTPDDVQRRGESSYAGIGVRLARPDQSKAPIVAEVFPNSPAQAAGVHNGDQIIAADGQDLTGRPLSDAVSLIRGPTGTSISIRVKRLDSPQPLDFNLTRAQVQIEPVVAGQITGNAQIGYLRIRSFADDTPDPVGQVLAAGRQQGVKAWILDLRGNPGGSLAAVEDVAAYFVPRKPVGFQVDRRGQRTPLVADGTQLVQNQPVVVLIDHDTASGAEILAAALHEYGLATLVGDGTAGNVGVAGVLPMPDGSAVQITQQRYVTPFGARLDPNGLQPDVTVSLSDADLEAGRDPQLNRAATVLMQKLRSGG